MYTLYAYYMYIYININLRQYLPLYFLKVTSNQHWPAGANKHIKFFKINYI